MGKHFAVPLVITESDGIRRINEPVTVGIPLPKGQVFNPVDIALYSASNECIPWQSEVLARWSDGSVQWLLIDFLANVAPKTTVAYALRDCVEPASYTPDTPITVQESPTCIAIDTGYALFYLKSTVFSPFERIIIQGRNALDEPGSSMVLLNEEGMAYQPCIRLYQDLKCILHHDQLPSEGGAYAKLRGGHHTCREFTGDDRMNRPRIPGASSAF
jgi:YetA-like protein